MPISEALLPEFDQEMAGVRKTLERVPEDKFGWKPHEKSGAMGWLASHVANIPSWAVMAMEKDSIDVAPAGEPPPRTLEAKSRQELLETFDRNVATGRAAIAGASDARLAENWSLLKGGETLMTLPRVAVLRFWVLNHIIHHRAQLGVYLRLNDLPVPSLYGPSADEAGM
jgi:uncharacterized damage-inducible protein DinB